MSPIYDGMLRKMHTRVDSKTTISTVTLGSGVVVDSATTGNVTPTGVPGAWRLTFQDEFNGTALDRTKWSDCWFQPGAQQQGVGMYPANVAVTGGNLVLTLASSSSGACVTTNPHGGNNSATVGYQFNTGVAEARIRFPGNGSKLYNWPTWWTDGQSWPTNGEHDIAEVMSDGTLAVNYHSTSGAHNQGSISGYWGDAFHIYTLHRKVGSTDVYYDGVKVKSYVTDDHEAPHYLILNVGLHGISAFGAASQVKVDYVRAWQ